MTKVRKILCFLILTAVCIGAVGAFAFALDNDVVINLQAPEEQSVYPGDEVTMLLTVEKDENTNVRGIEVDMGYSQNMPAVTTTITEDTMGWFMTNFDSKNLLGIGNASTSSGYIEGKLSFTVPDDAEPDTQYTVYISDIVVSTSDSNEEGGTNYSVVNESVTITVLDFPEIEGVSVSGFNGEYDGTEHSLDVTIPDGASIAYGTDGVEYNLSSLSYKDAGYYEVYYQITQDKHKTITGSDNIYIFQRQLGSEMIEDIDPQTYTGSQIKPNITVSDGGNSNIISESDYTVSYGENINAGEGTVTVTANADGNYYGEVTKTFTINKANMNYNIGGREVTYDGEAHTGYLYVDAANPTYSFGLTEGTYDLDTMPSFVNAGTYNVYCKATADNYNDFTDVFTVVINPKELTDDMVSDVSDVSYTGSQIMPMISVSDNNLLTINDYTIGYGDNKTVADGGSVIVSGQNNYTGEVVKTFNILPIDFAEGEVTAAGYSGTYDGAAHSGSVSTTVSDVEITFGESAGSYSLTSAPAYTNAGTYTVYFKASEPNRNDYTGSFTVEIAQKALTEDMITGIASATYTGSQLTPEVTVADGTPSIISADDYTVSYGTNVTVAEGGSVTLTGKGNYTGTISKTFAIARADMTVSAENYSGTYDGTAHSASVSVSVPASAAVSYGTVEGTYDLTAMPAYTNAGTY
ncbi:MAG: hypothetical protein LUG66_02460, partial [Clostridiales bacterium]|nr:hypothetical protein [Clostridiales bacterium]